MVQGKINRGRHTDHGATPSRLYQSPCLHHPPWHCHIHHFSFPPFPDSLVLVCHYPVLHCPSLNFHRPIAVFSVKDMHNKTCTDQFVAHTLNYRWRYDIYATKVSVACTHFFLINTGYPARCTINSCKYSQTFTALRHATRYMQWTGLSVCLFVRPSRAGIASKRLNACSKRPMVCQTVQVINTLFLYRDH